MKKNLEFSEKERFLREIFESARLIAEKRELFREELSLKIMEKGGFE